MDINSVPLSRADEPKTAQNLFLSALTGLVSIFRTVFLPHLAVGLAVFVSLTYISYVFLIASLDLPATAEKILLFVFIGIYGAIAFGYSMSASCVFSLYKACAAWEEWLEDLFDQVKANMLARLDNMDDGIPKAQAKIAVSGSVREVVCQYKTDTPPSFTKWLTSFGIGCVVVAMRSVLLAKIVKYSGRTVNIGKLFASRSTLAGAVFLNLRFFALLLLIVLYTVGVLLILINLFFVWSMQ
jgi:hypothetical protein